MSRKVSSTKAPKVSTKKAAVVKPAPVNDVKPDQAKQAANASLYASLAKAGIATMNPRTGKALTKRNLIGHVIQAAINAAPMTVAQLAAKLASYDVTEQRIVEHVNYWIAKKRLSINAKKQVVLGEAGNPSWRSADVVTAAPKVVAVVQG